jgi:effector-binding domain-containing protein
MPKIHIKRSTVINASVSKIYEVLIDFRQWPIWSPWLRLEPGAKIEIAEDGESYQWEGKRVGSGKMTIIGITPNEESVYDLLFLKPFKSRATVAFKLEAQGNACLVTWLMDTSLPFYMGWMKKTMIANMNADYDRGLLMLKDYLEKGEVVSESYEEGVSHYPGCSYVGVTTECTLEEMKSTMEDDFSELSIWVDNEELDVVGEPLTIYHKVDRVKNQCAFTIAVPIEGEPASIPRPYHMGNIPEMKTFKILHEGPYKHLSNAWALGAAMIQSKEIDVIKGYPPFEIYENDPQDTADELLETGIYFPVKG